MVALTTKPFVGNYNVIYVGVARSCYTLYFVIIKIKVFLVKISFDYF